MGWLEGTAILTAVLVVVLVGSINDYQALFFYFVNPYLNPKPKTINPKLKP